jgi:hypothetical protein
MSLSSLELLVKETKTAFMIAKIDGVLDAGEVIQIAGDLAKKIQALADLSGSDKKALLLLALKKGLETSGGIDGIVGFENASAETKAAFQENLLMGASVAVDLMLSAASGKLDLRKPSSWKACLPVCLSVVKTLLPKDQKLLNEATKHAEAFLNKGEETNTDVKVLTVAPAVATVAPAVSEPKVVAVESVVLTDSTLNVPEEKLN